VGIPHKKITGRRREPRRHTLQNGIDYNMVQYHSIIVYSDKSVTEIGALMLTTYHFNPFSWKLNVEGCGGDEYLNGHHYCACSSETTFGNFGTLNAHCVSCVRHLSLKG
jgi:hypothetical protein